MRPRPITSKRIGPPIPPHPRRAHVPWHDPRCDQLAILTLAVLLGIFRADINICVTRDGAVGAHWPEGPKRNGYEWIIDARTGKRRRMTHEELYRPLIEWDTADVLRWRKTPRVLTRHGRHRPRTIAQWQAAARRRRVIAMYEAKSPQFGLQVRADRVAAAVRASGWPAYVMTLITMRNWQGKMRAFHATGIRTALLTEGRPEPDDWPTWAPYVDRLLGRFASSRRAGK